VILKMDEWDDMPEFIQEKKEPYCKIIIRCETEEDMNKMAELLGQKFTSKTKSAWFPYKSHFTGNFKNRYEDES
jgi:hypothetical protein